MYTCDVALHDVKKWQMTTLANWIVVSVCESTSFVDLLSNV